MSIKVEELRIGNLYNVPRSDQSPFRIDLIEFMDKNNAKVGMNIHKLKHPFKENEFIDAHPLTWELSDLNGIPLTDKDVKQYGHFNLIKVNDEYFVCFGNYKTQVKFYHEVQNYYYLVNHDEL